MRILNNIEYPVADSKGGNCYKNQNYKIFWHLFYQMENLAIFCPFWVKWNIDNFFLKNTEFLNVSWALILQNLLTQKSLNSNKLLLILYFMNYYNCETLWQRSLEQSFWVFKFDVENEIFHLFEVKEGIHTDSLSSNNYSINLVFSIYFPGGSFWFVWAFPTYTLFLEII